MTLQRETGVWSKRQLGVEAVQLQTSQASRALRSSQREIPERVASPLFNGMPSQTAAQGDSPLDP